MKRIFTGIVPALYTCYQDDGGVNYDETVRLAQWLLEKGAGGFYLCGSTGTGLLMTLDERRRVVESVAAGVAGQVPLMIHVGAMTTADSVELAQHAAGIKGVSAISSLPPQYYPVPFEHEIQHLSTIAAVSDLPFYPYVFGTTVDKYGIEALIEGFGKIPNMAGIKAFVADLFIHQIFLREAPAEWELLHGYDQCLAQALMLPGIEGAIGSSYNVVPEIVIAIYRAVQAGDYGQAIALHQRYGAYWGSVPPIVGGSVGRYLLERRGFRMGPNPAPLLAASDEVIAEVEAKMKAADFDPLAGGYGYSG